MGVSVSPGLHGSRVLTPQLFQIPAIEVFPTSLLLARLAGLEERLNQEAIGKLRDVEKRLREEVYIAPILRARTERGIEKAFLEAYKEAFGFYIQSGIIIWRALNHDYPKLLRLSQVSSEIIERLFFHHARRLERATFIQAVAGLRVLRKVGERVILAEERAAPAERTMPLGYLSQVVCATFITWCFLGYLQREIKRARRGNLRVLGELILAVSKDTYEDAVKRNLYDTETEKAYYWSPAWQEGEVEADLDKHLGAVKSFSSIEQLLRDLHRS